MPKNGGVRARSWRSLALFSADKNPSFRGKETPTGDTMFPLLFALVLSAPRLKIVFTTASNPNLVDGIALSRLELYDGAGAPVAVDAIENLRGVYLESEAPENLLDGTTATKWLDTNFTFDDGGTLPRRSELLLTLVHRSDQLLPEGKEHSRNEAERRLRDAGVDVLLSTSVVRVGADSLRLVPNDEASSSRAAEIEAAQA